MPPEPHLHWEILQTPNNPGNNYDSTLNTVVDEDLEDSTRTQGSITDDSKCDYIVYTVREEETKEMLQRQQSTNNFGTL